MGVVPILDISPLTLTRSEETVLAPTLPISRVETPSGRPGGGNADETYSPSGERSASNAELVEQEPGPNPNAEAEDQPSLADSDPTHHINFFA
jgi:hypothetical protein